MAENTKSQLTAMTIIANAGNGRSLGFQALGKAKDGDIDGAMAILKEANEALKQAHKAQSELLSAEASGETIEISILMIHAQDHLMTSMLGIELIQEIVSLYSGKEEQR